MKKFFLLLIMIFSFTAAFSRPIEWLDNLSAIEKQKMALERQLMIKQTVNALELTSEQRGAVIPMLEGLATDQENISAEKEKTMPVFSAAIIELREDMYINNGITDALKLCVKNSNCDFAQLEAQYAAKTNLQAGKVVDLLTPSQLAVLRKADLPAETKDAERVNALILNKYALYLLQPESGLPAGDDVMPTAVKSNATDIRLLNLFNVLFVTPDQSLQLLALLKSAKKDYDALLQRNIDFTKKAVPVLEKYLNNAALAAQYTALKTEDNKIDADYAATDRKYLKMLKEMLTVNQVKTIGNFTPIIDLPGFGQAMAKTTDKDEIDRRTVSLLTSANLIPLLQSRMNGDIFPPAAKKL